MMSTDNGEAADMMMCCASCGEAEVDNVTLSKCSACKSVRYCGVKCQKDHRPQHKRLCKKRAAEIRDEILFHQPASSHHGDCPICLLPLSLVPEKSTMTGCCSKVICNGCFYANAIRVRKGRLQHNCSFCRQPTPKTQDEAEINLMKRTEVNDPDAMRQVGLLHYKKEEYGIALEYLTKAAELGDVEAHHQLSIMYHLGHGVEKNSKKEMYYFEEAAIGGHPIARHNLGVDEENRGRMDRAMKHYIIAANLGHDKSMEHLQKLHKSGILRKKEFDAALGAHQAAVDATKSPYREAAAEALQNQIWPFVDK